MRVAPLSRTADTFRSFLALYLIPQYIMHFLMLYCNLFVSCLVTEGHGLKLPWCIRRVHKKSPQSLIKHFHAAQPFKPLFADFFSQAKMTPVWLRFSVVFLISACTHGSVLWESDANDPGAPPSEVRFRVPQWWYWLHHYKQTKYDGYILKYWQRIFVSNLILHNGFLLVTHAIRGTFYIVFVRPLAILIITFHHKQNHPGGSLLRLFALYPRSDWPILIAYVKINSIWTVFAIILREIFDHRFPTDRMVKPFRVK